MMFFRIPVFWACAVGVGFFSFGEESAAVASAESAPTTDPEMEAEIAYVAALVDNGYPDFTAPIVEATKRRWPESEARFFAIEIRGLVAMGDFAEAEKRLAALPDRKSVKYWAARLELANGYFSRQRKDECAKIYDEFFASFRSPTPELKKFYVEASYSYGQLLLMDRKFEKAAERYSSLLAELHEGDNDWCTIACETVELYLRLAGDEQVADRKSKLAAADKIVDKLLWQLDDPVVFGRSVSMKAHIVEMRGKPAQAAEIINEFKSQLQNIHEQLLQLDPDGRAGLLRQSPLAECLYLQAKMLWDAAQAEFRSTPHDDEKVKTYLFGPKPKTGGKRAFEKGCFAMFQGVFLNFETSAWAPAAGDAAQEIVKFVKEKYGAVVKTKITDEQLARVRAAQFRVANEKFAGEIWEEAAEAYLDVLKRYPEMPESVSAVERLATCYLNLTVEQRDNQELCARCRENADVVEGYLAERFAGVENRAMMIAAGDAVARLAGKEQEFKNFARADALWTELFLNYTRHPSVPDLTAQKANEFQLAERYEDAVKYWLIISEQYTNSSVYALSQLQLSTCYGKLGDTALERDYIQRYIGIESVKIRKLQAQFRLARMYLNDGLAILDAAATNDVAEATNVTAEVAAAIERDEKHGTAQIIRAVKNFREFAAAADAVLEDPQTSPDDHGKYAEFKEAALFMVGECWSRMNRPRKNLPTYRTNAAKSYEAYLAAFPEGKYAKLGYVKLGTIYTALGDIEKSRDALNALSQKYPDSDEAKNAKPKLAKSLMEMGLRKEATEIYTEMMRTDGAYTAPQFVNAGEALIESHSWDLANQAFEKAIRLAATNQVTTIARARIGLAKSVWKQGSPAEALEALEAFLGDQKMSRLSLAADANFLLVRVASDLGRVEKDKVARTKLFNAAIGALKKVRRYWGDRPQWEQDQLDLLSGDVLVDRMKAEEAMSLKEDAEETCGIAAGKFQVFIQSHGVSEANPLDKMDPGTRQNLERAYASLLPLWSKQGVGQADLVLQHGGRYLELFPNGKSRTLVENCMNQARADQASAVKDVKNGKETEQ